MTIESRFWAKVVKGEEDECWPWLASKDSAGYGRLGINGRPHLAHRVSYELHFGAIPVFQTIDHKCGNPSCVNPKHLQVATYKENAENIQHNRNSTSGIRGVRWHKRDRRWMGQVIHNGKFYHAGSFLTKDEAEKAVIAKRNELFTNNILDRHGNKVS